MVRRRGHRSMSRSPPQVVQQTSTGFAADDETVQLDSGWMFQRLLPRLGTSEPGRPATYRLRLEAEVLRRRPGSRRRSLLLQQLCEAGRRSAPALWSAHRVTDSQTSEPRPGYGLSGANRYPTETTTAPELWVSLRG